MKLPFVLTRSDFDDIKPRKHLGVRPDISPDQRDVLDIIDVLDQRSTWLAEVAIVNRNLLLVVLIACFPQVYALIQLWLKSSP